MKTLVFLILILPAILPMQARAAAYACPHFPAPQIIIKADMGLPQFDFSMNRTTLNKKYVNIKLPDPQIYHLSPNSAMTGEMRALYTTKMDQTTDKANGATCLAIKTITVTLRMRPVIYMASEFHKTACRYKALFAHEMEHVTADVALMDQYAPRIQSGLQFAFSGSADSVIGPMPPGRVKSAKALLKDQIAGSVASLFGLMMQERLDLQRQIDATGEYTALTDSC